MGTQGINRIVQRMRFLAEAHHEQTPDAQLIDRFVNQRDEGAFATLVHRHGPMVQAVCRRELQDANDAEDAFQATFLVFVRKADSLNQRDRVGSWLHGVAHRIARKARSLSIRRQGVPLEMDTLPGPERVSDLAWRELQLVLDEELERLPAKYREPIVLCYLEGLTYTAAAHRLGVPAGTVAGRLDRARDLLRTRLVRRGLTVSAGLLGTLLAEHAASAGVPLALLQATVEAGLAFGGKAAGSISGKVLFLANATLRALFYAKLKIVAGCILASAVLLGGGVGLHRGIVGQEPSSTQAADNRDTKRLAPEGPQPAPRSREAQRVVDRAILALGGKEKAAALQFVSWTTVWNPGEASERTERTTARGYDQIRMELDSLRNGKTETLTYVVNKETGWRRDPNGTVADLPAGMLATNQERFYARRLGELLGFLDDEHASLTLTGETQIDQRPVTGIRIEKKGQPTVQLYFDKVSGLLHRSETRLSPRSDGTQSTLVYTFEDYRERDGLKHYTRVSTSMDDQPAAVGHIRDFQVLDNDDKHRFDKP